MSSGIEFYIILCISQYPKKWAIFKINFLKKDFIFATKVSSWNVDNIGKLIKIWLYVVKALLCLWIWCISWLLGDSVLHLMSVCILCKIYFAIFYVLEIFSHYSNATLNRIKMQGREPHLRLPIPRNYRSRLSNRHLEKTISAGVVSSPNSHPLKATQKWQACRIFVPSFWSVSWTSDLSKLLIVWKIW